VNNIYAFVKPRNANPQNKYDQNLYNKLKKNWKECQDLEFGINLWVSFEKEGLLVTLVIREVNGLARLSVKIR